MFQWTAKKEKILFGAAVICAVLVLIGAFSAMANDDKLHYAPGTYLASASGIGSVLVAVEVSEDSILSIDLDVSQESPDVGGKAAQVIVDEILASQSVRVDEVTGATTTSKAVKEAVDLALRKASLAAVEAAHQAEMDNLNTSLDELQTLVDALTSENESLARENAERNEENENLRTENASQKSENESLKAENERLSEANADLERQLGDKDTPVKEAPQTTQETVGETETFMEKVGKSFLKRDEDEDEKEDQTEEETASEEETTEEETKAENEPESVTEEVAEETSHDLVSMTPVEEETQAKQQTFTNEPAFAPFYLGYNIIAGIQEALENLGYIGSGIDGYMGPGTEELLREYQLNNGLEATGSITPETVSYLLGFDAPGQFDVTEAAESNASLEDANLLEFAYADAGFTEDGNGYQVDITVTNHASSAITGISMDVVWYNQYGQRIATTNTSGNGKLKVGRSNTTSAILEGEELVWSMASMGVGAYTFHLAKPDDNGFSTYHVNLLTGEVQGS